MIEMVTKCVVFFNDKILSMGTSLNYLKEKQIAQNPKSEKRNSNLTLFRSYLNTSRTFSDFSCGHA